MKKQKIGKIGEDKACEYFGERGYKVFGRNYREKFGEIDILAKDPDRTLVFAEVKTLIVHELGVLKPEDNFTTQKSIKVKRMAEFYAANHPELIDEEWGWRIDLIAVEISLNGAFVIRHYKNI